MSSTFTNGSSSPVRMKVGTGRGQSSVRRRPSRRLTCGTRLRVPYMGQMAKTAATLASMELIARAVNPAIDIPPEDRRRSETDRECDHRGRGPDTNVVPGTTAQGRPAD